MIPIHELLATFHDPQTRHAALVHAPIVISLLIPVFAGFSTLRRLNNQVLRWSTLACFALLLISSLVTTNSGESAFSEIGFVSDAARKVADTHATMARFVWIFALVGLIFSIAVWLPNKAVALFASAVSTVVAIILAAWVGITAHHGGSLVYNFGIGTPSQPALAYPEQMDQQNATQTSKTYGDPRARYFVIEVKPLLMQKCTGCHGPPESAESGLSLTSANGLLHGGLRGPAVIPGHPSRSLLIRALSGDGIPRMPFRGEPLTTEQINILRRWIQEGAIWDQ